MKIVFVIDRLLLGGAENVFIDLVNRYYSNFNFDIITITQIDEEERNYFSTRVSESLNIFSLKRNSKFNLFSAIRLHTILGKYDIVHIHLRHTYRYVAWIKKIFLGKYKLILHDHEGKVYVDFALPTFDYYFISPDYYIGVCDKLVDWSIQKLKMNPNQTETLVNLPSSQFLNVDFTIQLKYKENNGKLICIGNIKPSKNQLFLAELGILSNLEIDFYGNNQNLDYFNKLSNIKTVKIISGVNVTSEIIMNYKIGVFASFYESGPLVILEYLLSGIPFVAYQVGGMADAIAEFFPEYFLQNFNIIDWQTRILELSTQSIDYQNHLIKINQLMEKYFNENVYKDKLVKIYNSLVKCTD